MGFPLKLVISIGFSLFFVGFRRILYDGLNGQPWVAVASESPRPTPLVPLPFRVPPETRRRLRLDANCTYHWLEIYYSYGHGY